MLVWVIRIILLLIALRVLFKIYQIAKKGINLIKISTYSKEKNGIKGEKKVKKMLEKIVNKDKELRLYNDLLIQKNKFSSQIDHIVVYKNSLIVIETKNLYGNVNGWLSYDYWIHGDNRNVHKIKNPLIQNEIHIDYLKTEFGGQKIRYFNVIAIPFKKQGDIAVAGIKDTDNYFFYDEKSLIRVIKNIKEKTQEEYEIINVGEKLKSYTKYTKEDLKKHITRLKGKYEN